MISESVVRTKQVIQLLLLYVVRVPNWILLNIYTAVKIVLDAAVAEANIGFAAVYESNKIGMVLDNVLKKRNMYVTPPIFFIR
jgi:hypothetical protein